MATEDLVMVIDKPHFKVKLHQSLLEVDLKEGVKKELEDVAEASRILRGSLGFLFQNVIPLDVPLKDIESVEQNEKGQVKIKIPHRRDITIPLEPNESKKLISKLNELIPIEKQREIERILTSEETKRKQALRRAEERFVAEETERTR